MSLLFEYPFAYQFAYPAPSFGYFDSVFDLPLALLQAQAQPEAPSRRRRPRAHRRASPCDSSSSAGCDEGQCDDCVCCDRPVQRAKSSERQLSVTTPKEAPAQKSDATPAPAAPESAAAASSNQETAVAAPAVNPIPETFKRNISFEVANTEQELRILASVPGVEPADLDIQVLNDALHVRGRRVFKQQDEKGNVLSSYSETFQRSFALPKGTDPAAVVASLDPETQSLTLSVPKPESARPVRIPVRSSSPAPATA